MSEFIRETEEKETYEFWCPGCNRHHFAKKSIWNIDLKTNTLHPSYLIQGVNSSDEWETDKNDDFIFENGRAKGSHDTRCHSFVRNGTIQYLTDCTHKLSGKTVPMEPLK